MKQPTFTEFGICRVPVFRIRRAPRYYCKGSGADRSPLPSRATVHCLACGRLLSLTLDRRVPNHVEPARLGASA